MATLRQCCLAGLLAVTLFTASSGLEWQGGPSEGEVIQACLGDSVTLPWTFSVTAGEKVINIEWHQTAGQGDIIIATYTGDHFFRSSDTGLWLSFLPNAGLKVSNFTWTDYGTYRVQISASQNVTTIRDPDSASALVFTSRSVVLSPPDAPVLNGGRLVADLAAGTVDDIITGTKHVQLRCGHFFNLGGRPVSVVWRTPSGAMLPSSSSSGGDFFLQLPNPVEGGRYRCVLEDPALVKRCVRNTFLLSRAATVAVDSVQATMTLLMSVLRDLQDRKKELTQQHVQQESYTHLAGKIEVLTSEVNRLQQRLNETDVSLKSEVSKVDRELSEQAVVTETLKTENEDVKKTLKQLQSELSDLQSKNDALQVKLEEQRRKSVAFSARFANDNHDEGLALGHHSTLKFDNVVTNVGNAYDPLTGIFTAPVNGTYAFFVSHMSVNGGGMVFLAVDKHGKTLDITVADGRNIYDQGSTLVTTHMTAEEQIWIRQNSGKTVRGSWWTIFTGFLVQAD